MSIEGQDHFFTIYFPGFVCFVLTTQRYQVTVYRTIGPLVFEVFGHRELIICPIDSNGDSLVFDSLIILHLRIHVVHPHMS